MAPPGKGDSGHVRPKSLAENEFVDLPDMKDVKLLGDGPINEISAWQEREEIEGLTLYDIYRKPRKQISDDREVEIECRKLNTELTCPVCLGILRETMVVMECLHRFCSQCITKSLRVGRKECPSCRIHVPSKRSLRPDPNFDALIATLYPNLEAYEQQEEKLFEEMNKRAVVNAFAHACKKGQERQLANRRKRSLPAQPSRPAPGETAKSKQGNIAGTKQAEPSRTAEKSKRIKREIDPAEMIDFILRKHPLENRVKKLDREFLRTSKQIRVGHLLRFLGKKLNHENHDDFEIIMLLGGKGLILDTRLTIRELSQNFWDDRKEMVLHYRLRPEAQMAS